MRTKTVTLEVKLKVRVHDEFISDDNDAIAIGAAVDRWSKNQPTVHDGRVDIGILKMKVQPS